MSLLASGLGAVSQRLADSDMLQVLAGYLSLIAIVLMLTWPGATERPNDSWFAVAQAMAVALMLIALAYGSSADGAGEPPKAATLAGVLCLAALSLPFSAATYAASFPEVPLAYALGVVPLQVVAFFGVGMALGALLRLLRVGFVLPLAIPGMVALAFAFDIWLGMALLNPMSGITLVSTPHLGAMALLSAITLTFLAWRSIGEWRRGARL